MPPARYYSSTAVETTITTPISAGATSMTVDSNTGWPTNTPFVAILEQGTSSEEAVDVTAVAGTTWTISRGADGTSALAHSAGAKVVHGILGRDFRESREHESKDMGVHGLGPAEALVGTDLVQTLTNKTLTSPTINGGTINAPAINNPTITTPTIASFVNAQHDHADADSGGAITQAAVAGLETRLTAIEAENTAQNTLDTTQNNRLTAAESVNTTQNTRLTSLEAGWVGTYLFNDFSPDRLVNSDTMSELIDLRQNINFPGTYPPGATTLMVAFQLVTSSPSGTDPRFGLRVDGTDMSFFDFRPIGTGSGATSEVVTMTYGVPLTLLTAGSHVITFWTRKGSSGDPNFNVSSGHIWMYLV